MINTFKEIYGMYRWNIVNKGLARSFCSNFQSKTTPDFFTWNKRISSLIRSSRIDEARAVFDKMEYKNTVTWNSMISGYVQRREMANARRLFDQMPQRDVVSWNLMISGYMSCNGIKFIEEGQCLFDQMPERDVVSWNTMISGYARFGRIKDALLLFNSMPDQNVVSWNAMLTAFLHNGDVQSAIQFYERMPKRDSASLCALVSGLIRNDDLDEAMRLLLEYGNRDDGRANLVHAYNTLIAGFGQRGRVDDARRLFEQIPCSYDVGKQGDGRFKRNVVSWNSIIMCYVKAGDIVSARKLFDQMEVKDTFSWNTMISGYAHVSDMEEASILFREMPSPDTFSWNSMISGFSQIGNLERAHEIFDRMQHKNIVSWNSMISGYEKNDNYKGAINLYIQMQIEGEKPDRHTLSSVLSVCAEVVTLQLGMQIHQQVVKLVIADVPIKNSLVTMYSRCGSINEAVAIFEDVKMHKNIISWNAMIGGYASHGFATEALKLFELMKTVKIQPTYITFIAVLNACTHVGLVDEGRAHFESMVSKYDIEPRIEHYASLVDIVGRHGQLGEAMNLIDSMPMEADKAVWGALLGACRIHNNVKFAQVAAEALMKLEPESSGPYVLLYNILADTGRWDEATEVRMRMDKKNIIKKIAHSEVAPTLAIRI